MSFEEILAVGGKANSLGRAAEVVAIVLQDKSKLEELYQCTLHEDAWVRMRAIDSVEKVARVHPEWLESYVDTFNKELSESSQASIQWHLAELYAELKLTARQKKFAINWLKNMIKTTDVDWIVSANSMKTLVQFVQNGSVKQSEVAQLLKIQLDHKSPAVQKRAHKLLETMNF